MAARKKKLTLKRKRPRLALRYLSIAGFKAVKQADKIPLGQLTLFIGRNGSGKSTVVEALQWLQETLFYGLQEATENRFRTYADVRNVRSDGTRLHLELAGPDQPVQYNLSVSKAAGFYSRPIVTDEVLRIGQRRAQRKLIWARKGEKGPAVRSVRNGTPQRNGDLLALATVTADTALVAQELREYVENLVVLRLSPPSMTSDVPLERRARGPLLDERGERLAQLIAALSAQERAGVTAKLAAIHKDIRGVTETGRTRETGSFALIEHMVSRGGTKDHAIPSWMLSEGMRRMTAIYTLLATDPKPSLLIIEEIENGLDPWTIERVLDDLREAAEQGIQILLTTHSPFLLDHVNPEEVVHVQRQRGESTYSRITDFADVNKYRGVVAPGAMYLAGYYSKDADDSRDEE